MAKSKDATKTKAEIQKEPKPYLAMTKSGFMPTDMESAYRYASSMAQSDMVKQGYRGNVANCLMLYDMSLRMDIPWQFLMMHIYMVHDMPAMDAQAKIALTNRSGLFNDPLDYEVIGSDPKDDNYKVRAYATRTSTGKVLYGPWITWQLVRGEGWNKRQGSKWLTMPEQMFHYRAASWFTNRHCPEVGMGMPTVEEAEEIPRKHIESKEVEPGNEGLKKLLAEREAGDNGDEPQQADDAQNEEMEPPDNSDERDEETEAKVQAEKEKLQTTGAGKKSNLF